MDNSDLEALVAYLDGELDPDRSLEMKRRLAVEADLAQALASLRANDALLRSALDVALEGEGDAPPPKVAAAVWRPRQRRVRAGFLAVAASLALLAVGTGLGAWLSEHRFETRLARLEEARVGDQRAIADVVARTLERHLSGQPAMWRSPTTGRGVVVTPVRTFRSQGGKWCREFTQVTAFDADRREALRGLACRDGDGIWRPQVLPDASGRT